MGRKKKKGNKKKHSRNAAEQKSRYIPLKALAKVLRIKRNEPINRRELLAAGLEGTVLALVGRRIYID